MRQSGTAGPFITQSGASARLVAGESIRMLAGTHLQHGSQVHACIAPGGPFCEEPGKLTLEIHTADQTGKTLVEVYGLRGERVLREELPGDLSQYILSIEGQLPGLYIVRVVSGQDVGVERIIKR